MYRVYAYYALSNLPCDPDEVTASCGIVPSKTWRAGDLVLEQGIRRYQHNGWRVDSQLGTNANLANQIASVLDRLSPGWECLCQLGQIAEPCMQCVIYMYEAQGPETTIDPGVLRQLGELNALLDYDIYCMGSRRATS